MNSVAIHIQRLSRPVLAGLAALLGAAVGWTVIVFSPGTAALALAAVLCFLLVLQNPALGALVAIAIVAVLPRSVYSQGLAFGPGELQPTDIVLLITLGAWLLAVTARPEVASLPPRTITFLLLAFLAVAGMSLLATQRNGFDLKIGLLELRGLLAYLLVFPIVASVKRYRDLEVGLAVVFALATAGSIYTLWRYVNGDSSSIAFSGGGDRVLSAPFVYSVAALVWAGALFSFTRSGRLRAIVLAVAVVNFAGLFVTFQRGAWLAAAAGILTIALLLARRARARFAASFGLLLVVGLLVTGIVSTMAAGAGDDALSAGQARVASLSEYADDISAQHRFAEWSRAADLIEANPITGIGLGGTISYYSPLYNEATFQMGGYVETAYIHNSYIWLALKLGLPALVVFMALIALVLRSAYRSYRRNDDPRARLYLLGALASVVALLALSTVGPHLNSEMATPYLAAMIAVIALVPRLSDTSRRREE